MKYYIYILLFIIASNLNTIAQSTFSEENIRNAVATFIRENISSNSDIKILSNIETIKFSQSNVSATIINKSSDFDNYIQLQIIFKSDYKNLKFLDISAKVIKYIEVPFAVRNISKSEKINSEDFEYKLVDETKYKSIDSNIFQLIGKKANKFIQKGSLISPDMLEAELLINRGDKVIILSNAGAISVRTQGTALEDGAEGQTIRVSRETFNKKILQGIVQSDASVLINLGNGNLGMGYEKNP